MACINTTITMSFNYSFENINPEGVGYTDRSKDVSYKPLDPAGNPVRVAYNPKRKLTTEEQVQQFYAAREKPPVFDQGKADRLQRMGRINQIGQGVKVLGDILGSALGANTKRSQPDQTAPALYQSYQNMLDRYEGQKEAFNYRDFQTKRDNARFGVGRADKNTATEQWNRRQTAIEKANEIKALQEQNKWESGQKNKEVDQEETKRYHSGMLARPTAGSIDKSTKPKIVKTDKATHEMSPAEYSQRRERALKNSDLLKERFADMFIHTPKLNKYNKIIPGQFVTTLSPEIKDDDLVRADLELEEQTQQVPTPAQTNTATKNSYSSMPY